MQNSPILDKPLPLNSFVLHRSLKAVHFSHKLKSLHIGRFKNFKTTEVMYELRTEDKKTFHTHRNHLIPYYPKDLLLFRHIQSKNEQNLELSHASDTSDMIQIDLYTSYDSSKVDDNVFVDDPFCNIDDDQSIMFDNEIFKSVKMHENHYHS